ncbi:Hypothetical protein CINCED_3A006290 [Cinara cedri]|uniref:Uncharacterized protein n=1 Tax=Cinara cedri TaxID=506608 RepID=A0A5E4N3K4_9HEMI|nr:Hypothetical protein CINCED_3A006290 [Cinara cedri]
MPESAWFPFDSSTGWFRPSTVFQNDRVEKTVRNGCVVRQVPFGRARRRATALAAAAAAHRAPIRAAVRQRSTQQSADTTTTTNTPLASDPPPPPPGFAVFSYAGSGRHSRPSPGVRESRLRVRIAIKGGS